MAVYKPKGSKFRWYRFTWKGEAVRRSTKQTNKRVAERIEAAHKTSLAKGEVGIVEREPFPALKQFSGRFIKAVSIRGAEEPRTVEFYREKLNRLLQYPTMANAVLDALDEALIEEYVQQRRRQVAPGTVDRQLATLPRTVSLSARVRDMPASRATESSSEFAFPGRGGDPILVTSLDHQHAEVRDLRKMPEDFVVHSLRRAMLTRLGLPGVDACTIMKIAGHSSTTISQCYVHPSPESVERLPVPARLPCSCSEPARR